MAKTLKVTSKTRVTVTHSDKLVADLAKAAGLTTAEAKRVLDVLGLKKLVRNANEMQEVLASKAIPALGMRAAEAEDRFKASSSSAFTLENLRLVIKPRVGSTGVGVFGGHV